MKLKKCESSRLETVLSCFLWVAGYESLLFDYGFIYMKNQTKALKNYQFYVPNENVHEEKRKKIVKMYFKKECYKTKDGLILD